MIAEADINTWVDACPTPACIVDAGERVLASNAGLRVLVGREGIAGARLGELFDLEGDGSIPTERAERAFRRSTPDAVLETRASVTPIRVAGAPGALLMFREVLRRPDQHKPASAAVARSDRAALEAASFAFYALAAELDAAGDVVEFRFVDVNAAAERELDRSRDALIGHGIRALFPINDGGGFFPQYKAAFLEQQGFEQAYEIPAGQPGAGWYVQEVVPKPDGIVIFNRDISALKAAEEARRQTLDTLPDAVFLMDANGFIRDTNAAASGVFGYARSEMLGRPITMLMPADYADRHQGYVEHYLRTGQSRIIGRSREVVARLADGEEIPMRVSLGELQTPEGPQFIGTLTDLREAYALQDELRAAQKMEALGRLAGGVAHDFNNLLVVIIQNAQLLALDLPDGELRELADEIDQAGVRAGDLTRQLLQFSRHDVGAVDTVDVGEAIESFARMARRLLGAGYALDVVHGAAGAGVTIDPAHLDQILLNLVVNARDAMPDGGTVRIRTETDPDGPDGPDGPIVRILVQDEGHGMSPEVQARVFDPFFSTKGERGTGLGLSTVFGVVSQAGGLLRLESVVDVGTRVIIELPLADGSKTLPPPPATPAPSPVGDEGQGRDVVLVDDDPLVRSSVSRWLTRSGYAVRAFPSAEQALATLGDGPIGCLVTDVVMPGTSGVELAERLRRVDPDLPVIYTSGWPDGLPDLRPDNRARFLAKPFAPAALIEALDGWSRRVGQGSA